VCRGFLRRRYNALRRTPGRNFANAYAEILVKARYATLDRAGPKRAVLDWLSKSHSDLDLAKACKEVLEHTRNCAGAGVGTEFGRSVKMQRLGHC
jgi:hypothetical protein